jgi:hypothetical protein
MILRVAARRREPYMNGVASAVHRTCIIAAGKQVTPAQIAADLREIDDALAQIEVVGARYGVLALSELEAPPKR